MTVTSRKLARNVAHVNMEKRGYKNINKHSFIITDPLTGFTGEKRFDSKFAERWRENVR